MTDSPSKIRHAGVVAKRGSEDAARTANELTQWLCRRDVEVALDEATLHRHGGSGRGVFDPGAKYDLVVVLGGDGTLLAVARELPDGVPILGVNLGNLGFLTEINRGELYPSLVNVLEGRFRIERRTLLDVELERATGEMLSTFRVLNDAVITKSALARIIELTVQVDGHLVARYRSDGVILATPTGSTAYSLAAGGPVVHPLLPVTLLAPLSPHALTLRPLVVPASSLVEVTLGTRNEEVYLTLDGQEGTALGYRDTVRVTRSDVSVGLVKVSGRTFYDSLRGKLRWGGLSETAEPPMPSG
jgi:NAD+ kinase